MHGIKQSDTAATLPTYIKMCKLKRFANNLTEQDIQLLDDKGFLFHYDDQTNDDRLHRIKEEIMHINENERINKAYDMIQKDTSILDVLIILFKLNK